MTSDPKQIRRVHQAEIDAHFFVQRLTAAAETIREPVKRSLTTLLSRDRQFAKGLDAWAKKQGIPNFGDETFYDTVARQIVYRMLGKILFYQSLQGHRPDLPTIDFSGLDVSWVSSKLREHFDKARRIDYQAIFETDICDQVPLPEPALQELRNLVNDLNNYNFSVMPQDVVGQVFERLIPHQERHSLGQYFTPEDLVDFINAFCIRSNNDRVLDPTCGSGTFLLRAYDRLSFFGQRDHRRLLDQLWGIDIAHFPAELATINLYRQNVADYANFPRIVRKDFFEVKPGDNFEFPPSEPSETNAMMPEQIPVFDGAVGNFPYIRQELIEKSVKGYKELLHRILVDDWLAEYPELFFVGGVPRLSGQADIYAYLFFHTARFIREGGRMGFVTSNAWLDVAYGYELQKFFLKNFKIVAILESRCEPWFEQSAVNTIVTILERCSDKEERERHLVKFVKVKRKLRDLILWDMKLDAINRWQGVDSLIRRIESIGSEHLRIIDEKVVNTLRGHKTYEDGDFQIRVIQQAELLEDVERAGKTVKWGRYLRAPEVYFEILKNCGGKLILLSELAEIWRGVTTGINEFFYPTEDRVREYRIEGEFLVPLLKSPKEFAGILVDAAKLSTRVFLCQKSKDELRKGRKFGALKYIEWGESQRTEDGTPWPNVPSVAGNKPGWWSLRGSKVSQIFWTAAYADKFVQRYSSVPIIADKRVYQVIPKEPNVEGQLLAAVLNSTLAFLTLELTGRVSLGEGALDTTVEEARDYMLIPNPSLFTETAKSAVLQGFDQLSRRPAKTIFDEVRMPDRRKLDGLVFEAIGLDPRKYLEPLYDGLTQLVQERLGLGTMRSTVKKAKAERDMGKIKRQVVEELVPQGPKRFPEEFVDAATARGDFVELDIPVEPLTLEPVFFGKQKIISESGWSYEAKSSAEAQFIIYAQGKGHTRVKIPKEPIALFKTVKNYEIYLRELRDALNKGFAIRIFDYKLADALTDTVFQELKLPRIDSRL